MAGFSLRIVDADFYQTKPLANLDICYATFRQADTNTVPVIRIFGATPNGQKACLHVHQVFPYIYVPVSKKDACEKFAKQFATSLDFAVHIAFGKAASNIHHYVYQIDVIRGTTFYGYHEEEENFLKIFLYNPNIVNKIEDLLLNGAIMNRIFQPYEAHIPYLLQFFIDHNLYGMNFVHLSNVKFRQPVLFTDQRSADFDGSFKSPVSARKKKATPFSPLGSPVLSQTCYEIWDGDTICDELLLPDSIERQSTCCLEVDGICKDILNKNEIKGSLGTCPGLTAIWEEERARRKQNNEPDIPVLVSQDRLDMGLMDTEKRYLEEVKMIIENRRTLRAELRTTEVMATPDSECFLDNKNSSSTPDKNEVDEYISDKEIDDSQPIVNKDIIRQSSLETSFSYSQILSTTFDHQLAGVLENLPEDSEPILSQISSISKGIEDECQNANEAEDEDLNETLAMSQHVYDDVEVDDKKHEENEVEDVCLDECMENFRDSWSESMLDNIPQLDGTYDIEEVSHFQSNRKHVEILEKQSIQLDQSTRLPDQSTQLQETTLELRNGTSCLTQSPEKCNAISFRPTYNATKKPAKDFKVNHMRNKETRHSKMDLAIDRSLATCNCPAFDSAERCKLKRGHYARRFRPKSIIPQLDGSSDADFTDSKSYSRTNKRTKTPIRTYERMSLNRKRILRARSVKSTADCQGNDKTTLTRSADDIEDKHKKEAPDCEIEVKASQTAGDVRVSLDKVTTPESRNSEIDLPTVEQKVAKAVTSTQLTGSSSNAKNEKFKKKKRKRASLMKLGFIEFSPREGVASNSPRNSTSSPLTPNNTSACPLSKRKLAKKEHVPHRRSDPSDIDKCSSNAQSISFVPRPVQEIRPIDTLCSEALIAKACGKFSNRSTSMQKHTEDILSVGNAKDDFPDVIAGGKEKPSSLVNKSKKRDWDRADRLALSSSECEDFRSPSSEKSSRNLSTLLTEVKKSYSDSPDNVDFSSSEYSEFCTSSLEQEPKRRLAKTLDLSSSKNDGFYASFSEGIPEKQLATSTDLSSQHEDFRLSSSERVPRKRLSTQNLAGKAKRVRFEESRSDSKANSCFYYEFYGVILGKADKTKECTSCSDSLSKFRYPSPENVTHESRLSPPRPASPSEKFGIDGDEISNRVYSSAIQTKDEVARRGWSGSCEDDMNMTDIADISFCSDVSTSIIEPVVADISDCFKSVGYSDIGRLQSVSKPAKPIAASVTIDGYEDALIAASLQSENKRPGSNDTNIFHDASAATVPSFSHSWPANNDVYHHNVSNTEALATNTSYEGDASFGNIVSCSANTSTAFNTSDNGSLKISLCDVSSNHDALHISNASNASDTSTPSNASCDAVDTNYRNPKRNLRPKNPLLVKDRTSAHNTFCGPLTDMGSQRGAFSVRHKQKRPKNHQHHNMEKFQANAVTESKFNLPTDLSRVTSPCVVQIERLPTVAKLAEQVSHSPETQEKSSCDVILMRASLLNNEKAISSEIMGHSFISNNNLGLAHRIESEAETNIVKPVKFNDTFPLNAAAQHPSDEYTAPLKLVFEEVFHVQKTNSDTADSVGIDTRNLEQDSSLETPIIHIKDSNLETDSNPEECMIENPEQNLVGSFKNEENLDFDCNLEESMIENSASNLCTKSNIIVTYNDEANLETDLHLNKSVIQSAESELDAEENLDLDCNLEESMAENSVSNLCTKSNIIRANNDEANLETDLHLKKSVIHCAESDLDAEENLDFDCNLEESMVENSVSKLCTKSNIIVANNDESNLKTDLHLKESVIQSAESDLDAEENLDLDCNLEESMAENSVSNLCTKSYLIVANNDEANFETDLHLKEPVIQSSESDLDVEENLDFDCNRGTSLNHSCVSNLDRVCNLDKSAIEGAKSDLLTDSSVGKSFACKAEPNLDIGLDLEKAVNHRANLNEDCNSQANTNHSQGVSKSDESFDEAKFIPLIENRMDQSLSNTEGRSAFQITPVLKPPTVAELLETAYDYGLGETHHKKAFCSNADDIPTQTCRVGGRTLRIKSIKASDLPKFETGSGFQDALKCMQREAIMNSSLYRVLNAEDPNGFEVSENDFRNMLVSERKVVLTPCQKPPSQASVRCWLDDQRKDNSSHLKLNLDAENATKQLHPHEGQSVSSKENTGISKLDSSSSSKSPKVDTSHIPKPFTADYLIASKLSQQTSHFSPNAEPKSIAGPVSSTPCATNKKALFKLPLTPGLKNSPKETFVTPPNKKVPGTQSSQIEGPTPTNSFGFGFTQVNYQDAKNIHEIQHLTMLSIELHIQTRRDLHPDPNIDPICAIFYYLTCDTDDAKETGIFVLDHAFIPDTNKSSESTHNEASKASTTKDDSPSSANRSAASADHLPKYRKLLVRSGIPHYHQRYYNDEKTMILDFVKFFRSRDPDVVMGYEVQMLSWGYVIERARELDINLSPLLSRIPSADKKSAVNTNVDQEAFLYGHSLELKFVGRILLNVWRVMRSEVTLRVYTFENVAFHVLHDRLPKYSYRTLSAWWSHKTSIHRWRVVEYYIKRCRANIEMLIRTDFISRTSELARLFGILFYSVISRGSQYRVESMMLRIAKPMGYIPVSPSVKQRANMAAPECIPLVMEPESRFYTDPVIVLDFQSLYPSIIIAYNYCFSTCLGRVKHWHEPANFTFATTSLGLPVELLERIQNEMHISPNGVGFVKSSIRKGVLPRMLDDILSTRIMVKNSMKKNKENKALHRMLDARQLGLKLIANVTYGYTSANFSGRMPSVEIADSVVRKARETLEVAINLINTTKKWNARVVYGDTDSVFVLMKGATKERAFAVSDEIIKAVTEMNPKPIKLKFEKVYMPCILQTKKRYIGYMYESLSQKEPVFDAKGIETVRRDSCPAVSKILERSLKTLFESRDISLVKKYVQRQFTKIMEGRISMQDLTFAKEYRGMKNYKPNACVPALALARRLLAYDKRAEPRVGERVPYVIVYGTPGLPLIQLVRRPIELFQDPSLRLNGSYYITKQIAPSLNRAFSLIGVDVIAWYNELPRPQGKITFTETRGRKKKGTISQYFSSVHCPICDELTRDGLCASCRADPQTAVGILSYRITKSEQKHASLSELCYHCTGSREQPLRCISHDCPILHKLYHVTADLSSIAGYRELLDELK